MARSGIRSAILDSRIWTEDNWCMADSGFTIVDDLKALNVELKVPTFLSGRNQLTKAKVK